MEPSVRLRTRHEQTDRYKHIADQFPTRADIEVEPGRVRLSVGIEHSDTLLGDLEQAIG